MPSIEQNKKKWTSAAEWEHKGDQWSEAWGGPLNQWNVSVHPRISKFLPCDSILEIAPGYGRWTAFLKDYCKRLIGLDLNQNCTDECRARFASNPNLEFHTNDGKSLAMIDDESVDFVFSLDSLVHAEFDVLNGYISQLPRILRPGGAAFLHHSNFGAHRTSAFGRLIESTPVVRRVTPLRNLFGVKPNHHWRARTVSAELVRDFVTRSGLYCSKQELITWGVDFLNDCFTTITKEPSKTEVIENYRFMEETELHS
jgi:SAM-dependent methyltransferase